MHYEGDQYPKYAPDTNFEYIPYLINLEKISPDNGQVVKNMEYFCMLSGVFYKDIVIVQSEDVLWIYINVLSKVFDEKTRTMWEQKKTGLRLSGSLTEM